MLTKIFCVYDSKALCYGVPFFLPSVGAAVRAFSDLANDRNTTVNRHPGDFVLYNVGSFDDSSGIFVGCQPMVSLGVASDFVVKNLAPGSPVIDKFIQESLDKPLATVSELRNGGVL